MAKKGKKSKHIPGLQKKTKKVLSPHGLTLHQGILQEAMAFHRAGHFSKAEALYKQILRTDPDHPEALYNLGMLIQQVGQSEEAIKLINRAIARKPDNVDAYINLGILLKNQGRLEEAIANFRRALTLKPHISVLHYNIGVALHDQGKFEEALESYRQALSLKPDFVEALCNLGAILKGQGKIEEAIASFRKAISLKPDYPMAYINLGYALIAQGKLEEAVRSMEIAVENAPGDSRISDHLMVLLNNYMPNTEIGCPYVKIQKSLQQVKNEYTTTLMIADETVREIYQQCSGILALYKLQISTNRTELFRGAIGENDCHRHLRVFNTFNIIPRCCFDCFKVTFEPRTVIELFKLLFVFDKLKLPNDNPRKCMVEIRPKISGTYKGFIYCKSINEGKDVLNIVKPLVDESLFKGIPIFVKRGCSEFLVAYPEYGHIMDNKTQQMSYNEEWCSYEKYADKNMRQLFENSNNFTNNHSGFTLLDILVMRKWLEYAAKIGDLSYLKIGE